MALQLLRKMSNVTGFPKKNRWHIMVPFSSCVDVALPLFLHWGNLKETAEVQTHKIIRIQNKEYVTLEEAEGVYVTTAAITQELTNDVGFN